MKKEIQPHQARVLSEYFSLEKSTKDLQKFVQEDPLFAKLPGEEAHLLNQQLVAMFSYWTILEHRLALWGIKPSDMSENSKQLCGIVISTITPEQVNSYNSLTANGLLTQAQAMEMVLSGEISVNDARGLAFLSKPDKQLTLPHISECPTKAYLDTPFAKRVREMESQDARDRDQRAAESPLRGKLAEGNKEAIIKRTKELRMDIDTVLQNVKAFGNDCIASPCIDAPSIGFAAFKDRQEVPANVKLCQRHLEDAIMRLGMTLKAIGATNPYPESYNPDSNHIEPTADNLKL